jgi:hypothetical protein
LFLQGTKIGGGDFCSRIVRTVTLLEDLQRPLDVRLRTRQIAMVLQIRADVVGIPGHLRMVRAVDLLVDLQRTLPVPRWLSASALCRLR